MANATLNRTDARTLIEANPRRTLVVRFIKRTTGEVRRMVCIHFPEEAEAARFRFNPAAKGLIAVWDVEKGARRFVNLDGVREIKAGGQCLGTGAFTERRAPDRTPVKGTPSERAGGSESEKPETGAPPAEAPAETPEKDRPSETPWEDLEQADREMAYLFDTFTI